MEQIDIQKEIDNFYTKMMSRPEMYIGKRDLSLLYAFFSGIEMASNIFFDKYYKIIKPYFNSWVEKVYNTGKTALNWSSLIIQNEKADIAFQRFVDLYNEFLNEYNSFIPNEKLYKYLLDIVPEIGTYQSEIIIKEEKSTIKNNRNLFELEINDIPCKYGKSKYERDYFKVNALEFKALESNGKTFDCYHVWNVFFVEKSLKNVLVLTPNGSISSLSTWRKSKNITYQLDGDIPSL